MRNARWDRLLEYLDRSGWERGAGAWTEKTPAWRYTWLQLGTTGASEAILLRRKAGVTASHASLEGFSVGDERRCLEVAADVNADRHPPSPPPNSKGARWGSL
jgi:hypothetical protein